MSPLLPRRVVTTLIILATATTSSIASALCTNSRGGNSPSLHSLGTSQRLGNGRSGLCERAFVSDNRIRRRVDVTLPLRGQYSDNLEEDERGSRRKRKDFQGGGGKKRLPKEEDDYWEEPYNEIHDDVGANSETEAGTGNFNSRVDEAVEKVCLTVSKILEEKEWKATELENEKEREESCWPYRVELQAAVERVSFNLVERDEEARLIVLGLVSREHVLFLGPPGTGKSELGRRLSSLCDGDFFQRLLTRFTTPDEIFGPLSLRALENDEYRRCTAGFLPTASVAFLDEIFKANSAILNTLLTILNERQFDNGGGEREDCPIRCVVGASNELPESDELDAIYDRFLLRKEVKPVSDQAIVQILSMSNPGASPCDDISVPSTQAECQVVFSNGLDEVVKALSAAADNVHMGEDACFLMRDLRTYMRDELDVDVSDRRLVKAARLLKISAACHGRTRVDPLDCLLLQHMAWRLPTQRPDVREWLWDHVTPGTAANDDSPLSSVTPFRFILDNLRREAVVALRKTSGDITGSNGARQTDILLTHSLRKEASNLLTLLYQRSSSLKRHMELLRRSMNHIWLDPDEARAAQQILLPRAQALSREVDLVLANASALELVLSEDSASPSDDLRVSVLESLWDDNKKGITFTAEELSIGMREAKVKYDADTFRAWKRSRKKQK